MPTIISAKRIEQVQLPKGRHTQAQLDGLAFERDFIGELARSLSNTGLGFDLCHNPWFEFTTSEFKRVCCPDAILSLQSGDFKGVVFVLEIKRTYTDAAISKLREFYCPVVSKVFSEPTVPVVICKHSAPGAPRAMPTLFGAIELAESVPNSFAVMQWLGHGKVNLGLSQTINNVITQRQLDQSAPLDP